MFPDFDPLTPLGQEDLYPRKQNARRFGVYVSIGHLGPTAKEVIVPGVGRMDAGDFAFIDFNVQQRTGVTLDLWTKVWEFGVALRKEFLEKEIEGTVFILLNNWPPSLCRALPLCQL